MIRLLFLLVAFSFSGNLWSAAHNSPACAKAKAACEKAGFKGGKKGKSLVADCLKKLTAGKAVKGVKMKPGNAAVASCKKAMKAPVAKGKSKPEKKAAKGKSPKASAAAPSAEESTAPSMDAQTKELEIPPELEQSADEGSTAADPAVAEPVEDTGGDSGESGADDME